MHEPSSGSVLFFPTAGEPVNAALANEIGKLAAEFMRDALQRAMEAQLVAAVERLTGRTARPFLSGMSTLADDSVEIFVLEPHGAVIASE